MTEQFSTEVPELLQSHLEHLKSSAISIEIIKERGYRSVYGSGPELVELGFSAKQRRRPAGILIPLHGVDGEIVGYQYRPDNPREEKREDGRIRRVKYENPPHQANRLDVPPRCRKNLGDPTVPCFITEGTKKVDALVSAGAGLVLGLTGVWNFRGTNKFGGKALLADFQSVAFNSRTVYIVFDSDSSSNPHVISARDQLAQVLINKGADVKIINLPPGPEGAKVGADDYLAQGHTLDDLIKLTAPLENKPVRKLLETPYRIDDGIITYFNGQNLIQLGNFSALITEVIQKDDGLSTEKYFKIVGKDYFGKQLPEVEVPCADFESMSWVVENWDVRANISADRSAKNRIREALINFSYNAKRRYIYAHAGWREIEGKRTFLTAGGALGMPEISVELDEDLADYRLPQPLEDRAAVLDALNASLDFLKIGNIDILLPIWAAMYMSPLTIFAEPCFTLFVAGLSGTYKSGITALALNHFGPDFNYNRFPASWNFTENKLEKMLFIAKDLPLAIDDWAPGANAQKAKELESKAERIIREQANRQGRGRLSSDTSSRRTYRPRGFLITSGEHIPGGYSATARMFVVEVMRGDIDRRRFFAALDQKQLYSQAMTQYLLWINQNWELLKEQLPRQIRLWTNQALEADKEQHVRLPAAVAHLYAGLSTALSFFQEAGALTAAEAEKLCQQGWETFMRLSREQCQRVEYERPGRLFLEGLTSLKDQGHAVFWSTEDEAPRRAVPGETCVGWYDPDENSYYLNPQAAYELVRQHGEKSDRPLTVSMEAVCRDLLTLGYSEGTPETRNGRFYLKPTYRKRIYGALKNLIKLKPGVL